MRRGTLRGGAKLDRDDTEQVIGALGQPVTLQAVFGLSHQQVIQRPPLHQPHVDVEVAVDLAPIMDRNDVWLLQNRRGAGLALEPRAKTVVVGVGVSEDLQCDGAALVVVVGLVLLSRSLLLS